MDLFLRECWVLKRLISRYYFLQNSSISSIKYKTVKDYFGTVESSHYFGDYSGSEDSDSEESDVAEDIDHFEQEYTRMEESFNEMSFLSSKNSSGHSKPKSPSLNSSQKVFFEGQFGRIGSFYKLTKSEDTYSASNFKLTKSKMVLDNNQNCRIQSQKIKNSEEQINLNPNLDSQLMISKDFSEEGNNDTSICASLNSSKKKDPQTNRYHVNLNKNEIIIEKNRLKNVMYGPIILIARNKKEYYKIMNFRRHRIFKLETIREIEAKYDPQDKYFEAVKDFKTKIERYDEKNIRGFLKFFYFEE